MYGLAIFLTVIAPLYVWVSQQEQLGEGPTPPWPVRETAGGVSVTQQDEVGPPPIPPLPQRHARLAPAMPPSANKSISCNGVSVSLGFGSGGAACIKPGSGKTFRDCPTCPEMVVVPAGSFLMGSPKSEADRNDDEGPQRKVTFAKPFAVGKFEVTWDEWDACVRDGECDNGPVEKAGGDNGWGKGRRPVIEVDWSDAKTYAAWLSKKTGKPYRLLTEAEWEYAARAGTTTAYFWGDKFDSSRANNGSKTAKVGRYRPNAWGVHDMHGNVWEWTEDCWNDSYKRAPTDGSAWTDGDCSSRVVRGGSWGNIPALLRSALRHRSFTYGRYSKQGFRLGRTITP